MDGRSLSIGEFTCCVFFPCIHLHIVFLLLDFLFPLRTMWNSYVSFLLLFASFYFSLLPFLSNRYDERSWYPLGRPVGTTIYPGLQILSALVYHSLNQFGWDISLNDVCVYQPAWFSIVTCLFTFGITYECSRSTTAGLASSFIMAIVPAHIMRSVAGGYDNESIAIGAMCMTFYFWVRSLRSAKSGWIPM